MTTLPFPCPSLRLKLNRQMTDTLVSVDCWGGQEGKESIIPQECNIPTKFLIYVINTLMVTVTYFTNYFLLLLIVITVYQPNLIQCVIQVRTDDWTRFYNHQKSCYVIEGSPTRTDIVVYIPSYRPLLLLTITDS